MKISYVEIKTREAIQRYYDNGHRLNIEYVKEFIKGCNFNDFCDLCTAVHAMHYSEYNIYSSVKLEFSEQIELKTIISNKIDEIFGDELVQIYNTLMKSQGHEQWAGDERYMLFSYAYNPYSDATVIKSAIKMKELYVGKVLSLDDIEKASRLMKHGDYWEMYPVFEIDFSDGDKRVWLAKKENLDRWHEFMSNIAYKHYDKALEMIKKYDEEYDKIQSMRKNKDYTYYDYLLAS